ncbi:MAG: hypothetical protein PHP92_05120 [Candidatus Nanoarchaeia archaeon]|nr:hypothetical protein [Candidatus Nanoarchaeia archaeon]
MKYYEIMELEYNTPIKNRSVGADFYICTEKDKEKIESEITERGNNFYATQLTKERYEIEKERIRIKNLRMIARF